MIRISGDTSVYSARSLWSGHIMMWHAREPTRAASTPAHSRLHRPNFDSAVREAGGKDDSAWGNSTPSAGGVRILPRGLGNSQMTQAPEAIRRGRTGPP